MKKTKKTPSKAKKSFNLHLTSEEPLLYNYIVYLCGIIPAAEEVIFLNNIKEV